jgi:hypothetical protein
MTTIISADNGSVSGTAGLKSTADASGILALQTGANTTAVTIDASQNMGLGVTPSAWSTLRGFDILSGAGLAGAYNTAYLSGNCYFNGTNWIYKATSASALQEFGSGFIWKIAPSGTAGNAITFTQALTLNTNGALVLQGGNTSASGVGVAFPATQSASSDANTLDDYEEGTWTPNANFGWTDSGTVTRTGTYTKVGRQVFVTVKIAASGGGSVSMSLANISNLPFTAANATVGGWGIVSNYGAATQTQNVLVDGNVMYFTGSWVGVANYTYTVSATYTV